MCLSYAIRLLLTDTAHTKPAEKLLEKFLDKTQSQFDEFCFTINVHYLTHLCWQVKNFGPLWSTSAFMFESANNMLSKPFTGTVNHLDLIIERYIRRKKLLLTELRKDNLVHFANSLRTTKTFSEQKIVDTTSLPLHFDPNDVSLFSTMSVRTLNLDSLSYFTNNNAYVSFKQDFNEGFGEIVVFQKSDETTCLVNVFSVVNYFSNKKCTEETEVLCFVEVKYSGFQKRIPLNDVSNKLMRIDIDNKIFLSVLIDHFEHD